MSLYVCVDCPLTGTTLGEWDSEHSLFKNILQVHKQHKGFRKGTTVQKKTIENEFTEYFEKNYHRMLHVLIHHYKGPTKSCLLKGARNEIR